MLVVDINALQTINFLDLVDEVVLQSLHSENTQDVVRVERAVHERFARTDAVVFLHVDVRAAWYVVFALTAVVADYDDLAFALCDRAEFHGSVDLGHHSGFAGTASFEKFNNTRQTTNDVFRLSCLTRNFSNNVARLYLLSILNDQVRTDRHLVGLLDLITRVAHLDSRLIFLVGILDDETLLAGDLIDLFLNGLAFFEVLIFHDTLDLSQDRKSKRIPGNEHIVLFHLLAVLDMNLSSVNDLVMSDLAAAFVNEGEFGLTTHRDHLAVAIFDHVEIA